MSGCAINVKASPVEVQSWMSPVVALRQRCILVRCVTSAGVAVTLDGSGRPRPGHYWAAKRTGSRALAGPPAGR